MSRAKYFAEKGFFLVGDSAYAIRNFLITPYKNASPGTPEDMFNYYLSSCRIYIECAFGEIDQRFGIFWRELQFNLETSIVIIDATLRLHNYLVEFQEESNRNHDFERDYKRYEEECYKFSIMYPDEIIGCFGDGRNDEECVGRPSNEHIKNKNLADKLRNFIKRDIEREGMRRPCGKTLSTRTSCNHTVMW